MDGPEGIPLGDGFYAGAASFASITSAECSQVSEACWETCDPNDIVESFGHQALARATIENAMLGNPPTEQVIEVEIQCSGQKGWRTKRCGAKLTATAVSLPLDETHPEHPTPDN